MKKNLVGKDKLRGTQKVLAIALLVLGSFLICWFILFEISERGWLGGNLKYYAFICDKGRFFDIGKIKTIMVGKTNKRQILSLFGQPWRISRKRNEETIIYFYGVKHRACDFSIFRPRIGEWEFPPPQYNRASYILTIQLRNDIVEKYKLTVK